HRAHDYRRVLPARHLEMRTSDVAVFLGLHLRDAELDHWHRARLCASNALRPLSRERLRGDLSADARRGEYKNFTSLGALEREKVVKRRRVVQLAVTHLPLRLIGIAKFVALRRHEALGRATHLAFDDLVAVEFYPTEHKLVGVGDKLAADRHFIIKYL